MKINNSFDSIVHTVQLSADNFVDTEYPYFVHDKSRQREKEHYRYIGNIAKTGFNPRLLSGVKSAIDRMENEPQLINPRIVRIDYAADDYFNDYENMFKINLCLISLAAMDAAAKNNYKCKSILQPQKNRTIKYSTKYIEMEYYNKEVEESTKDKPHSGIKGRFEYRVKSLYDIYKTDKYRGREPALELTKTILHLERLVCNDELYEILQNRINDELIQGYSLAMQQNIYSKTDEFITEYREHIFARSQLVDLYARIGYDNPEKAASRYKTNHKGMEFITYSDLKTHVNDIVVAYKRMIDIPNTRGGKIKK